MPIAHKINVEVGCMSLSSPNCQDYHPPAMCLISGGKGMAIIYKKKCEFGTSCKSLFSSTDKWIRIWLTFKILFIGIIFCICVFF